MARSTFEGPVLSGDNRFGPLRNVGYMQLVQDANIILTNTTVNTAGYGGASGQFVNGNGIPNFIDPTTPGFVDTNSDGVDDRYDTDRDGDGAPNRWDRNPGNPYWR